MKTFMVFVALVAVTSGQYDYTGPQRQDNGQAKPVYGPPQREFEESQPQQPQPLPPQQQPQPQEPTQQAEAYTPQVFRHVYVHAAPDEPVDEQARIIKVPGGDKHVNIIFVKTPSQSSQSQTEVILPEQDEQKNLVYVLLKKQTAESNIRIRRPPAQRQQRPEVYFIRYKDQEQQQQNGGNGNGNGGYSQGPQQNGNSPSAPSFQGAPQISSPPPTRNNGGSNGNGYSEAGRYTPALAPGPIRSPADIPSSGYGVPL